MSYDIVGAIVTARALVFTNDEILVAWPSTCFDMNPALLEPLENQ
jgi:hypothetical protein